MKRLILASSLVSAFVLLLGATTAAATEVGQGRNAGIGFAIGEFTGIVGKLFLNNETALDAGLSFNHYGGRHCYNGDNFCDGNNNFALNGDYLWEMNLVRSTVKLDWHIGVGGRVLFIHDGGNRDTVLMARMPLGLDLTFPKPNFLEVFFELSPLFWLNYDSGFDIEPMLGVRFYP